MVAGVALDLIRFPHDVGRTVGVVLPGAVQFRLVVIWGPLAAVFAVVSLCILASYRINRARLHEIAVALGRGQSGAA